MRAITEKVYYDDPFLSKITAKVIGINEKGIIVNRTVAFPEGGGQEGDRGKLTIHATGEEIPFHDTQKGMGRVIFLEDFPTIQVDTPIYHEVELKDIEKFSLGMEVTISIDIDRRYRLSASHSATHLMLMGIEKFFGPYESRVYGCHIKEEGGRLDFRTPEKFAPEKIIEVEEYVNQLISANLDIRTYRHEQEPEALYWECNGVIYACGGMHLTSTAPIGQIKLKKKGLGKNGQRALFTMNQCQSIKELYHE
jgi:Ser-tRNA(Ala) deacylase AlaX